MGDDVDDVGHQREDARRSIRVAEPSPGEVDDVEFRVSVQRPLQVLRGVVAWLVLSAQSDVGL